MSSADLQKEIDFINDSISKCDKVLPKNANRTVVFLGNTGAGKSTVFNILCGNELIVIENQYDGSLNFDLKYPNDSNKIGNSATSCTSLPSFKKVGLTTFIDTPGLEDNNGIAQQIINIFYIKKVFSVSSKVKIMLVFDYDSIMVSRGKNLGDLFNHLLELIPNKQLLKKSMNFLITRCPSKYTSLFFRNKIQELCQNNNDFQNSSDVILSIVNNLSRVIIFKSPLNENDTNFDIKDKILESLEETLWSSVNINPSVGESAQSKLRYIASKLLGKLNNGINKNKDFLLTKFQRISNISRVEKSCRILQELNLHSNEDYFLKSLFEFTKDFEQKSFLHYFFSHSSHSSSSSNTHDKILEAKRLLDFYSTIIKVEYCLQKWKEFIPGSISILERRKETLIQEEKIQQARKAVEEREREYQRLKAEREEDERRLERLRIQMREQEERNRQHQEQLRQERLRQEQREREHQEYMENKRQEELYWQRRAAYSRNQSGCAVF